MINIEINNDDRQKAVEVLKYKNFGNRSSGFNGNYEKQYTGLIGELTTYRLLEMDPPNYNEGRIDTDILVNDKKIDIKSMLRKHDMRDDWVHNFVGYQKEMTSDILLFVNINMSLQKMSLEPIKNFDSTIKMNNYIITNTFATDKYLYVSYINDKGWDSPNNNNMLVEMSPCLDLDE